MTTTPGPPTREQTIGNGVAWASLWSLRLLLIAAGAVVLGLLVQVTWSILLPVVLALLFTSVLQPPTDLLARRLRFPRGLAAGVTLLGFFAALVAVGFAIAPSVAGQSTRIVEDTSAGLQELQDWVQGTDFVTADQIDNLLQSLQDGLSGNGGAIASGVLTGLGAVSTGLITIVLAIVLTFLFLKDGKRFLPMVDRLSGRRAGGHLTELLARCWSTLGGFIRTQALVSLIDAVLIGAGLLIVGVPLAIPLAILTFIAGFIPIAGAFVAGGVAVLVALVSVGPQGALIVLAIVVAVQQFEGNVLSPILQSRSMQLHPAVVILSVTLASTLFGVIGAFLAVPVAAVAAVVVRFLDERVRETTGEPDPRAAPEEASRSDGDDADEDAPESEATAAEAPRS